MTNNFSLYCPFEPYLFYSSIPFIHEHCTEGDAAAGEPNPPNPLVAAGAGAGGEGGAAEGDPNPLLNQ